MSKENEKVEKLLAEELSKDDGVLKNKLSDLKEEIDTFNNSELFSDICRDEPETVLPFDAKKETKPSKEFLVQCPECGEMNLMIALNSEDNPGDVKYLICSKCRGIGILPVISVEAFKKITNDFMGRLHNQLRINRMYKTITFIQLAVIIYSIFIA